MISDTLHDAVSEIDKYLQDDVSAAARMSNENYGYLDPDTLDKILRVRDAMEELRCELDTFPDGAKPTPRPNPMDIPL